MNEERYYVYVLKSLRNEKRYVGSSRLLPRIRLVQHNSGSNKWTKQNGPFELVYCEEYSSYTEARKRENFLKTGVGRKFLDQKINTMTHSSASAGGFSQRLIRLRWRSAFGGG